MPADVTPSEAVPTPTTAEEKTVVVKAADSAAIVYPAIVLAPNAESISRTQVFYVPAMFEAAMTPPTTVAEAQPLMLSGSSADDAETAGLMQNWWQRGTAMLLVCLGALAPFSSRRLSSRDEADSVELKRP